MNKFFLFLFLFLFALVLSLIIKKNINEIAVNQFLINNVVKLELLGFKEKEISYYAKILKNKNRLLVQKQFYKKINILWRKDLAILTQKKILPLEWFKIKSIEWNNNKIKNHLNPPIYLNPSGTFHLKIYTYLLDNNYSALVIQYNLIKVSDQNLLWELSRTLKVK